MTTEMITRAFRLDDVVQRGGRINCDTCGRDATGRVVDAYAAVFNTDSEISDAHGHYIETIDPAAWNKRLSDLSRSRNGLRDVAVFYNHGHNLYGAPSDMYSTPVGHPMAIRADGHGLLTSTHYGTSDVSQRVFTDLVDGNLSGHSFTGRIVRSDPNGRVPISRAGQLPRVRRLELGLAEYGPTPLNLYADAQLVGVRADSLPLPAGQAGPPAGPPPDDRDYLRRIRAARLLGKI